MQANLQGEVAHMLRFIPNVLGFLGGMDNPQVVRQSEINRILGTAEESAVENTEISIPYSVDETVKVIDGPFSGFSGVIEEVNSEKRKLKVMVKIFGRKTFGVGVHASRERIRCKLRYACSIYTVAGGFHSQGLYKESKLIIYRNG